MEQTTQTPPRFVYVDNERLRCGYTTGTCACAAAKAAALALLTNEPPDSVAVKLPGGETVCMEIEDMRTGTDFVSCAVTKDGGDDPDATDGMKIYVKVTKTQTPGIDLDGGEGIGRVTKKGLACEVGQAAINPVPRAMIAASVQEVLASDGCRDYRGGLQVTVYAPEGEERAKKTFNPKLGIVGGISILGTSGIVYPMSEAALLSSVELNIKMMGAAGRQYLVLAPGNYAQNYLKLALDIDEEDTVKCSNFIGDAFRCASREGFRGALLTGHLGKLVKLAAGVMNTHSRYADARMQVLAAEAAYFGASTPVVRKIMGCVSVEGAIDILDKNDLRAKVIRSLLAKSLKAIRERIDEDMDAQIILFTNKHGLLGKTAGADKLLKTVRREAAGLPISLSDNLSEAASEASPEGSGQVQG